MAASPNLNQIMCDQPVPRRHVGDLSAFMDL